jgi:septal ring factor EnvC (AmiA/AmiB activator)
MRNARKQPFALSRSTWQLLLFATLLAGFATPGLAQSDTAKTRNQLQQLEKDIKRINWEISTARTSHDKLQQQLRTAEVELGTLNRDISGNQRSMKSSQKELAVLEEQRDTLEEARNQQQARIALELKTAWQMGRQGQVKVLLSQESPHTVARSLGYYRYFFRARNTLLSQYRGTLLELQQLQERIDSTLAQLEVRRETLSEQQAKLTAAKGKQELALAELSASISSKAAQLKQKTADRKELEKLLRAVEEAVEKLTLPDHYQDFSKARGKMPWPVPGRASSRFGRPRNEGKMRWQGVTIPAKAGSTIKAIHHGRVVYADWLRGSGLLLIIDHGDGYMSLYAHNQSLLKDVGEWVTADTPIGTVGNTGGQERSALYFEVRHNGKPTDPAKWCRK